MVLTAWGKLWKSRIVGLTGEGHGVLNVDTDTYKRRNRVCPQRYINRLTFARVVFMLVGAASL